MELSSHSMTRMQQRGIAADAIEVVREHGRRIHTGGAVFCFLGRRDIPDYLPATQRERLEGLPVVLSTVDETVVTVYKNRNGLRDIKRKKRYDRNVSRYDNENQFLRPQP
jgi:hypothetical protein